MSDPILRPALQAGDPDARIEAIGRLDPLPEAQKLAPLIVMLGDPEWRVRKAAAGRLKKFSVTGELLSPLIGAIVQDGDPWLRTSGMETLVSLGCRDDDQGRVLTFLLEALRRHAPGPRKFIVETIGQLGDARAVQTLIAELRESDENLQMSTLLALAQIGDRAATPAVVERLTHGQGQVRFAALSALQQLADPAAVPVVLEMLAERPLRRLAIETLGQIGDVRAMAPLWHWWTSGSLTERDGALMAMAQISARMPVPERAGLMELVRTWHGPVQAPEVVARLTHADPRVQQAAAILAGWVHEPEALEPLIQMLGGDLAPYAQEALVGMVADHVDTLLALLPRATPALHRAIIELLGPIVDPRLLPIMRSELASPDNRTRRAALLAIAANRDGHSAPAVVLMLSDGDENVQETALTALAACGNPNVVPAIVALLSSESPVIRRNAVKALGLLRTEAGGAPLGLALNDPDPGVRAAAIASLDAIRETIGDAERVKVLTSHLLLALGDEAPHVRLNAARALERHTETVPTEWWACLANDPDQWVRAMAARLAGRSRGPQAADMVRTCLRDDSGAVQIAALEVIGRRPELGDLAALRPSLSSNDGDVVAAALNAATAMLRLEEYTADGEADASLSEAIRRCLSHPAWVVRIAALQAMGVIDPADARRQAEALMKDPHERVREAAAGWLGRGRTGP